MDKRIIFGYLLISLPALCATVFGVTACERLRPVYDERERTQKTAHYREIAESMRDDPSRGVAATIPTDHGRIRSMKPGNWGYFETDTEALVWYRLFERAQVERVPKVKSLSFVAFLWPTFSLSLLLFWVATIIGCGFFRKSVKDRDDFIAATAHDLRSPLITLRRLIGTDDAEAVVLTDRMLLLVRNLTDFLRLGGRQSSPEIKAMKLSEAFKEAYSLFAADYRWLREGEDISISGDDASEVLADERMLHQILWNLISNELKYAASLGPVSVRIENEGRCVKLIISDCGPGISTRDRKRIFRRYYRAKTVLKSGKGGFGLGLSTAREFARMLGGDLSVELNPPKGSRFILTLRRS